jgi:hypothetical protein
VVPDGGNGQLLETIKDLLGYMHRCIRTGSHEGSPEGIGPVDIRKFVDNLRALRVLRGEYFSMEGVVRPDFTPVLRMRQQTHWKRLSSIAVSGQIAISVQK